MKITYKTNSEVYDLLVNMEDRTPSENATLAYVEKFLKYDRDVDIPKLYSDIGKIHKFSKDVITKIIDIKPSTPEELIAILNSYNINVDNKVLDSIIDILKGL
jgi:DNA-directed RNA polymerase subunit F